MVFMPPTLRPDRRAKRWQRLRDTVVYHPLAFAEPAESIELALLALQIQPGDTVAGITSSGDLLLAALGRGAARVVGFDANPTQTALARLKRTLCDSATLEQAAGFLGLARQARPQRRQTWLGIRARLGPEARLLERHDLQAGVLNCGMSRKLIRLMSAGLRVGLGRRGYDHLVSPGSTPAERLQLYHELCRRRRYRSVVKPILNCGRRLFQHFFFPPAFCHNSDYPKRALSDILSCFCRLFEIGFSQNPVFCRHLTHNLPVEQVQHLYSSTAWSGLQRRVADIRFETCGIEAGLRRLQPGSVDAIYLSNAPDYLRPQALRSLAAAIHHAARPGARIYYLSLEPRCPLQRNRLVLRCSRAVAREERLRQVDPVGLYRTLGVLIRE